MSQFFISHYLELLNSHLPKELAIKISRFSKDNKDFYQIDEFHGLKDITFTKSEIYKSILFATHLIMKIQEKNPEELSYEKHDITKSVTELETKSVTELETKSVTELETKSATEGVTEQELSKSMDMSSKLPSKSPSSKRYGFSVVKTPTTMAETNKDDSSLNIPQVPSRKKIASNSENIKISAEIERDTTLSNTDIKKILIECQICKKVIRMPVPKKIIEESPLPVTDVTYIHGDPPHAVTAQLDRDFEVRRRRSAPVIFEDKSKL